MNRDDRQYQVGAAIIVRRGLRARKSRTKPKLASLNSCSGCEGIWVIPVSIGHGNGQAICESVPPVAAWPPNEDGFAQGIPEG